MEHKITTDLKFELQQQVRRAQKCLEQLHDAQAQLNQAKANKMWIVGVISMLFAMQSDFFLGISATLLTLYFYQWIRAAMAMSNINESLAACHRWFSRKGYKMEGRVLYRDNDGRLDSPIDPFDENSYAV